MLAKQIVMAQNTNTFKTKSFLTKNWYKLIVVGFCVYIFFHKDLSFSINLKSPLNIEQPDSPNEPPQQTNFKELEKITEQSNSNVVAGNSALMDRFDVSIFGSGNHTTSTAKMALSKIDESTQVAYLKRFAHVAITEQKKYGIPASIILANALLHSSAGQNQLASTHNNQFALNCGNNWSKASINIQSQCFRKYKTAWASFRDHSTYLTSGSFKHLRQLGEGDYKAWAAALEKGNFSSEPNLSGTLIEIIEKFQLYK